MTVSFVYEKKMVLKVLGLFDRKIYEDEDTHESFKNMIFTEHIKISKILQIYIIS